MNKRLMQEREFITRLDGVRRFAERLNLDFEQLLAKCFADIRRSPEKPSAPSSKLSAYSPRSCVTDTCESRAEPHRAVSSQSHEVCSESLGEGQGNDHVLLAV